MVPGAARQKEPSLDASPPRYLGVENPALASFYYLEPGAVLHPHRDLTGASLNNRLRFHIPVITNDSVDFQVSRKRVVMRPGELWCLDTSYLHSVENKSDTTRVHIIIECIVTEKITALLPPRGVADSLHSAAYVCILGGKLAHSLLVNPIKNPKYLKAQLAMIRTYLGWRVFGKTRKPTK